MVPAADEQLYADGEAVGWARPTMAGGFYTRGQISLDADVFATRPPRGRPAAPSCTSSATWSGWTTSTTPPS